MKHDDMSAKERQVADTVPLNIQKDPPPDTLTRIGHTGATFVLLVGVIALVVAAVVLLRSWCECPVVVPR